MNRLICTSAALAVHHRLNQTTVQYPDDTSVKELFETCAKRRPDATAVIHNGQKLTYGELNWRANALAAVLRQEGVHIGAIVGLHVDRSPELVVALVAIIKCGAIYLPFDAAWPAERLHIMFAATGCAVLLTDRPDLLTARFPHYRVLSVRPLDVPASGNPLVNIRQDDLAYINFTSGSTGIPKGVPIAHHGIIRLVFGACYCRLDPQSVLLHLAPISFDAATFEIWGALLNRGTCVLYPSALVRLSELKRVIDTHGVTTVFLTTALFNTIVDEAIETLSSVETILTGGEAHSIAHMRRAVDYYGPDRVVSVYGPTEATTFATFYPVRAVGVNERALPIGRPIQNTRAYLISDGQLCPPGRTGELCLAGPGLSPGYFGMPNETRERFGEWEIDGRVERLYRTGDLAYLSEDDQLVFQGRNDDQVKINGHRIELGEVKHYLDLCPLVKQAFVTVQETATSEKRMVAFIIAAISGCTPESVRAYLRQRLPRYLVPASIHMIDTLPLSANGKVDRRALLEASDQRVRHHLR